ncbi:uncharacterized protein [Nicotiana tomentosiformis]|uniref:uncharacterized protein n=1 Tax=Nicotiana tomentosiformis TaxID=4098 RepID=UPI00388CE227
MGSGAATSSTANPRKQDPGSTMSYITPFVVGKVPELLQQPFEVSMPVGESLVVWRVYRDSDVMIHDHHTLADLNELEMVEFDVIIGMDWRSSCYAIVDCLKKDVHFNFPGEPVVEWKADVAVPKRKFISYLKAQKMITKGCLYHLVRV